MESFPKKYNPKDLRKRSKSYIEKYKEEINNDTTTFSQNTLPCTRKLSYQDFFLIYLRDFFNYKTLIQNWEKTQKDFSYEQLFTINRSLFENIFSSYCFFLKKNQSISQIWTNKLERHIISSTKKHINRNHKIIDSFLSSTHKMYIPDSDLYIYILEQFNSLLEKWKIINKTWIWYRSFDLQTSIPSEKISRIEKKTPYYVLKYFIWTKAEALPIYIEDVDLCCGDVGLLVHPKDKRYNKHIWKNAIIPLCNRQIPIIWDDSVNIAINNWIKRICPCCDEESINLAKKYWLPTDIYVFDKEWLYTKYIHEKAFVWQKRNKYYDNIVWFIEDIWNLAEKWEKITKIPYLNEINERLVPYKINQIIIDLKEEKQKIINKIFTNNIKYASLNDNLSELLQEYKHSRIDTTHEDIYNDIYYRKDFSESNLNDENQNNEIEQKIINELDKYLPNSIICNSQLQLWRKIPLIKDDNWNLEFFNIKNICIKNKQEFLQFCFDFAILFLIRAWTILIQDTWENNEYKLFEYNKLYRILSENTKKIEYTINYMKKIIWTKPEYDKFLDIIENIKDENDKPIKEIEDLIKNCNFLTKKWNYLFIQLKWIINDTIDSDFVSLCIPCFLHNKWVNINEKTIFDENEKSRVFKELLIQELLLDKTISNNLLEYSYNKDYEFLWDKQLSKAQLEQSQRNTFSLYWENPIRLNFLINKTYDQKQILINNIFLKQIWNAIRLCIQKNFLPKNIEELLNNEPEDFEDFDVIVLYKLKELHNDRLNIETYEEYTNFFNNFKESIQNIFFSWYLEIQKISPTKDVQFVCSYFFNFLLTIIYPLTPEFVNALQYISKIDFIKPLKQLQLNKTINYNMNILYNAFIKIKEMKIEYNIQQHESCNIFIRSTPTINELFSQYEQIFTNYFHISDICYLRLHEQIPLWYEVCSNDTVTIGIQQWNNEDKKEKDSLENIEKNIKNLDDKLNLIRQRLQILPSWEQRTKTEKEYEEIKKEMEDLTIKYSLLRQ